MFPRHGEQHRATRLARAAAETAEIELKQLLSRLVSRDEVQRVMENVVTTYREKIHDMDGLTPSQKSAVCELISAAFCLRIAT